MAVGQITWEKFITSNNDARGVRYKFEDLSRQLFAYEFLSKNNVCKYIHSNPNNPGIESEPILDEVNNRYILDIKLNSLIMMQIIIKLRSQHKKQSSIIKES